MGQCDASFPKSIKASLPIEIRTNWAKPVLSLLVLDLSSENRENSEITKLIKVYLFNSDYLQELQFLVCLAVVCSEKCYL